MEGKTAMTDLANILFTAMNTRELSELEECLAEDAVFDFPGAGTIAGKKKILLFLKILFRMYPRLTFTVQDIIIEGDQASAVWTNEGESKEGRPYQNRGVTLLQVSNGQIVSLSDYFKDTSFVRSS
jgi:ketosteroid isomerase-like protein